MGRMAATGVPAEARIVAAAVTAECLPGAANPNPETPNTSGYLATHVMRSPRTSWVQNFEYPAHLVHSLLHPPSRSVVHTAAVPAPTHQRANSGSPSSVISGTSAVGRGF